MRSFPVALAVRPGARHYKHECPGLIVTVDGLSPPGHVTSARSSAEVTDDSLRCGNHPQPAPDTWRQETGFSPEIEAPNGRLFHESASDADRIAVVNEWIQKHQPCLFGRIAAKSGFLSYCVLTDADLKSPDHLIRDKIQAARLEWTRDSFEGRKNGFIIVAVSEQIATATPDDSVKELALRLASLYLLQTVVPDQVFHDEIWLEKPGRDRTTWKWFAGVNYFSAQGDKRWWHDHRIPGGLAFSINSVGHMVKSGILAKAMDALEKELDSPAEGWTLSKVNSLGKALVLAMQTINSASDTVSGKATELLPIPRDDSGHPVAQCPIPLSPPLADKNFSEYRGRYHTDFTVPSEYFRPDVIRPDGIGDYILDFTYLFRNDVDNPDFTTMGSGRPIREGEGEEQSRDAAAKARKMDTEEVPLDTSERLVRALGQGRQETG